MDEAQTKFLRLLQAIVNPDDYTMVREQYELILQYTSLKAQREQMIVDRDSVMAVMDRAFGSAKSVDHG